MGLRCLVPADPHALAVRGGGRGPLAAGARDDRARRRAGVVPGRDHGPRPAHEGASRSLIINTCLAMTDPANVRTHGAVHHVGRPLQLDLGRGAGLRYRSGRALPGGGRVGVVPLEDAAVRAGKGAPEVNLRRAVLERARGGRKLIALTTPPRASGKSTSIAVRESRAIPSLTRGRRLPRTLSSACNVESPIPRSPG
jgi:hypothetical protein